MVRYNLGGGLRFFSPLIIPIHRKEILCREEVDWAGIFLRPSRTSRSDHLAVCANNLEPSYTYSSFPGANDSLVIYFEV